MKLYYQQELKPIKQTIFMGFTPSLFVVGLLLFGPPGSPGLMPGGALNIYSRSLAWAAIRSQRYSIKTDRRSPMTCSSVAVQWMSAIHAGGKEQNNERTH